MLLASKHLLFTTLLLHGAVQWCVLAESTASLAKISFSDLKSADRLSSLQLSTILQREGAVLLTDIPGFNDAVTGSLDALASCFVALDSSTEALSSTCTILRQIGSNVQRRTLATSNEAGDVMPFEQSIGQVCPTMVEKANSLRAFATMLMDSFAKAADLVLSNPKSFRSGNAGYQNQTSRLHHMVSNGRILEHFHHYRATGSSGHNEALPMHTDAGLLQAIAVRWHHKDGTLHRPHGLVLETSSGKLLDAEGDLVDDEGRSGLLFIVGQGAQDWFPQLNVRAVPHSVSSSSLMSSASSIRLVYSMMLLPPEDWLLPSLDLPVTFGEWWDRAQKAVRSGHDVVPSAGIEAFDGCLSMQSVHCSLRDLASSCPAGKVYCWMQCQTIPSSLQCAASDIQCVSETTGRICGTSAMNSACKPTCVSSTTSGEPSDAASSQDHLATNHFDSESSEILFCSGAMTTMHMLGFTFSGPNADCLIFLFPDLELTSATKFWVAVVGTGFLGIACEFVVAARRRWINSKKKWCPRRKRMQSAVNLLFFALTRTLGYFLMLLAMTFSVEIFIAVLIGLMIGHAMFNLDVDQFELDSTPCCPTARTGVARFIDETEPDDSVTYYVPVKVQVSGLTCQSCLQAVMKVLAHCKPQAKAPQPLAVDFTSGTAVFEVMAPADSQHLRTDVLRKVIKSLEDVGFTANEV